MNKNLLLKMTVLAMFVTLVSCGGGNARKQVWGARQSSSILASEFVNALNSVDGTYSSSVELYSNETLRSQVAGQDDWFVIWDAKFAEYKAVSLQYIRSIVYYDYYSNNNGVAKEFRTIESSDILAGRTNGDTFGNDYEVVDRTILGYYEGRQSGYLYEDGLESKDVALLAQEKKFSEYAVKAAQVSMVYSLDLTAAARMVQVGKIIENMKTSENGELTEKDSLAIAGMVQSLTGVTIDDMNAALENKAKKEEVLSKMAASLGTSAQNLEQKILPSVFGITL